jgi:predicted ATPase
VRIESVHISRYRSLYDVHFQPGDFTVLVGANNSGKTNLVDAIDFLAEAYRYGLEIAVGRKGGFENIAHRKKRRTKSPLAFTVVVSVPAWQIRKETRSLRRDKRREANDSFVRITHSFAIAARSQRIEADYEVRQEHVRMELWSAESDGSNRTELLADVTRTPKGVEVGGLGERIEDPKADLAFPFRDELFVKFLNSSGAIPHSDLMVSSRFFNPVLSLAARALGNTRVYQLAPIEERKPGVPTPNPDLEIHGGNLPAFVAYLRKNGSVWAQILDTMRRVVPGLDDIDTAFTPDRRLALQFHEANVGRPWASEDVSDGTVQMLALLAALHDPRTGFVLIEEPENSVHPWIIRNFVAACRAVKDKQIVLTTHSPALINTLSPEEVLVATRSGGETTITPLVTLDPDSPELWRQGRSRVFEMLDSGWLPEAVPGVRP